MSKRRGRRNDHEPVGYLFILPFYVFLVVCLVMPIVANIVLSFTDYDLSTLRFVGLRNYHFLFTTDLYFVAALQNTVVYTSITLVLTMALGLAAALLLNRRIVGQKVYRTAFFAPHVISMVASSMIWLWLYEPSHGVFNRLLAMLGVPRQSFLFDMKTALTSIIAMSVWKYLGYNMVIYLAGLQTVPRILYEAAEIDGAGAVERFVHITWPWLVPVTFFLFVTGIINNFNAFEQVLIMTNGGPANATTTLVHQIYANAFQEFRLGYAATIAVVVMLVMGVVIFINLRFGKQSQI